MRSSKIGVNAMVNANSEKSKKYLSRNVLLVIILCIIMAASAVYACIKIYDIAEETSFNILRDTNEQLALDVKISFKDAENNMDVISEMLTDHTTLNAETCQRYLNSIKRGTLISNYTVLLPGGENLYAEDVAQQYYAKESFGFDEWKEKEPELSRRFMLANGDYAVALNRTIVKDEQVVAVLLGFIRLSELPEIFPATAYDGKCQLYLADGRNGDFLMDTWHDSLGNMYDENLLSRPTKAGNSFPQMKQDVEDEKSGYVVFTSRTTGEDFYSYYSPVGVYKLSYQMTVSDTIVFNHAKRIQTIVIIVAMLQVLSAVGIVAYIMFNVRATNRKNREELFISRALNEIQKTLFDAYKSPLLFKKALGQTAQVAGSNADGSVSLISLENGSVSNVFLWSETDETTARTLEKLCIKFTSESLPDWLTSLKDGQSRKFHSKQIEKLCKEGRLPVLSNQATQSLIMTPILDSDGEVVGLLSATNITDMNKAAMILERVSGIFFMSLINAESYGKLCDMSEIDSLTGLRNRNAFNRDVRTMELQERKEQVQEGCIYIDANGLHFQRSAIK